MSTDTSPVWSLELDEAKNTLYGIVAEPPEDQPVTNVSGFHLQQKLQELGYQDFLISSLNINNFLKKLKDRKPGRYLLGERRDAKVEITISSDRLSATLKLSKAWGGKRLSNARIVETIKYNKIARERILVEELKKVAEHPDEDFEVLIAQGLLPTAGQDAHLQALLSSQINQHRDPSTEAAIDQREVYDFAVVEPGQPLLRKIPSTAGKPGMDVLGKEIPAQAGKDIQFATPFEGVETSTDDENVLVATIKGHPVFSKNGVKVDPVLHLESVDIHSGNIDYDGSVFVKQNITSGFTVKASGDIHVKGQVEKANVFAKGSIIVGHGILGEEEDGKLKARLSCEGNLHARFINLAFAHCGGEVHVDEYIMQSHITASGDILVGQSKGRGRIFGGVCNSEGNIHAKTLGSDAYVATSLVLGSEANENHELNLLHAEQARRDNEVSQLKTILEKIRAGKHPSKLGKVRLDKVQKIENTIAALEDQVRDIELQINDLEKIRDSHEKFKVHVSGTIYPNVSISICGKGWHCETGLNRQTFYLDHKHISHIPLDT